MRFFKPKTKWILGAKQLMLWNELRENRKLKLRYESELRIMKT